MSDTPETDAQEKEFLPMNMVRSRFARKLERELNKARDCFKAAIETAENYKRERDEARELAYCLYWAAFDLKRFARAYAEGYDEVDGVQGEEKAEEAFYEASRNIAKVLDSEAKREAAK